MGMTPSTDSLALVGSGAPRMITSGWRSSLADCAKPRGLTEPRLDRRCAGRTTAVTCRRPFGADLGDSDDSTAFSPLGTHLIFSVN